MNDNKNYESQNYLSGFDSVEQAPPKKPEGTFTPTPMFSGMTSPEKPVTAPKTEPEVKPEAPVEVKADIAKAETPTEEIKATAEQPKNPVVAEQKADNPSADATPAKTEPPVFVPSGTYSYLDNNTTENKVKEPVKTQSATPPAVTPSFIKSQTSNNNNNDFNPQKPKKKEKKYGAGILILSVLLAAVIGAGSGFLSSFFTQANIKVALKTSSAISGKEETKKDSSKPQSVTNIQVDETANSTVEAVAQKAGPSIVGIRTTAAVTNFFGGSTEATGEGSGIIYTSDGYIITNYHVIESAVESSKSKVEVFLADDTDTAINATVVGYNIASDLAVVKVAKTGLPAVEFADSSTLKVGQYVVAIGNPGGLEFIGSVSYGVISGLNRSVTLGTGNAMSLIQTDAAINPGNSGGALVDITGKLIGVNSVKLVSTGYEGMGFAIPSNTVKQICNKIIENQNDPTPYIGIQISQNYTAEQLIALGYPAGAVVVSVAPGGPAAESQIQRGDIITEFNGKEITNFADLDNAILQCKPGDSVPVKIFRTGRFYSTHINVASNNAQ